MSGCSCTAEDRRASIHGYDAQLQVPPLTAREDTTQGESRPISVTEYLLQPDYLC